jgi:uncharacterized integral membrane protein (TIGR00698 family)
MVSNHKNTFIGVLLVFLISLIAYFTVQLNFLKQLAISPLISGIIIGMIFANTLRVKMPEQWQPGIAFCCKTILRLAIVLYGFRITFQEIAEVGIDGLILSTAILISTFLLGILVGIKVLKLDRDTSILVAAGSAVCGAAAVLATESSLNSAPYKTVVAVGTVVLFGTISLFLYPMLYKIGVFELDYNQFGLYVGSSIHEVAQVIAAADAINSKATDTAVIVKMTRVMMLAPLLLTLGLILSKFKIKQSSTKSSIPIPWFVVLFILVAGFNSLHLLPQQAINSINLIDTFLLTMAMTALGMETHTSKFRQAGFKPLLLALLLFIWLIIIGYILVKAIS